MGRTRTCSADEILAGFDPKIIALANRIRRLIHGMIDGVGEAGLPARGRIQFRRCSSFAFLEPDVDHVRLGFDHGAALPNFGGLLEGSGRHVRTIPLRSARSATSTAVKTILSAALFDDETHGFRRRRRSGQARSRGARRRRCSPGRRGWSPRLARRAPPRCP
jgi:hypothetical protein